MLSHETVTTRLERLSKRNWRKTTRSRPAAPELGPSTTRKFGTVGDAVIAVLSRTDSDLRVAEVHGEIAKILDGHVSLSSVKNSLARNCNGPDTPFERVAHGRYRLRHVPGGHASSTG